MGDMQAPSPFFMNSQPSAPPEDNQNKKRGPIIGWNPNLFRKPPQRRVKSDHTVTSIVTTRPLLEQQTEEHVSRNALQQHVAANSKIYIRICIGFVCLIVLVVLAIIIAVSSRGTDKPREDSLPKRASSTTSAWDW